jgi:F-type H+-transporting ATPase subunit epsilon
MANRIHFELASPEKRLVNKPVVMAMVPGSEGLYGVLAGHAPMMTNVGAGVVEIYENDDQTVTERYFVAGGFAEVEEERCVVLAEQVFALDSLNRTDVEKEVAAIEERLADIEMGDDREPVYAELAIANTKLRAVS